MNIRKTKEELCTKIENYGVLLEKLCGNKM